MEKDFPDNNKQKKIWTKPSVEKLSLRNTESGSHTTTSERAKTDVYGNS